MDALTAAIAILVMAAGAAVQAAVGIGLALVVVPLLALVDPVYVPGPVLAAGALLAAAAAYRERHAIDAGALRPALAGLALGTVIGAFALSIVHGLMLPKVFGACVLVAVAVSLFGPPMRANRGTLGGAGIASGVMGTMVGIHGPPIALVFQNAAPAAARATLSVYFTIAATGSVAALAAFGLFGTAELARSAVLLPGAAIGFLIAPLLARRIDRAQSRIAILAISSLSALAMLLR